MKTVFTATALLAGMTAMHASGTVLIDYTFDSNAANDVGPAVQVVDNAVANVPAFPARADTGTGVLFNGTRDSNSVHSHAIGFNSSGLVDVSSFDGFTATIEVDSIDIGTETIDGLLSNGIFFGVVSWTNAAGTAGSSLFINDPAAFGYVPGGANVGNHTIFEDDGTTAPATTAATTTTPTDASFFDGFTISISLFSDDTWSITSTGLSTDLNQTGSLNEFTYASFAGGVGLNTSVQGQENSTLDIGRMTLTAVPEPGSLALLGLGGLLIARRRRG